MSAEVGGHYLRSRGRSVPREDVSKAGGGSLPEMETPRAAGKQRGRSADATRQAGRRRSEDAHGAGEGEEPVWHDSFSSPVHSAHKAARSSESGPVRCHSVRAIVLAMAAILSALLSAGLLSSLLILFRAHATWHALARRISSPI